MLEEEYSRDVKVVMNRMKSLEERLAVVEGELIALKLGSRNEDMKSEGRVEGITKQTLQLNNMRDTQPIEKSHAFRERHIIEGDHTKVLTTLSKIVDPVTKRPYNKKVQNKDRYNFGDRVKFKYYTSNFFSKKNRWEEKRGYIVGHTKHFVYIAEEPISEYAFVHKKSSNNVIGKV